MSTVVASTYTTQYLDEVKTIAGLIDPVTIDRMIGLLRDLRQSDGRLFILGVGGSAGNAGHAVNDFRKICGIEAYAPTDNVAELTARVNDDGWESTFINWLKGSRLRSDDAILVFSVGGGNLEKNISGNIVHAVRYAKEVGCTVLGIVGRDGGYTAEQADACIVVPTLSADTVTPHAESWQAVVWHLIVSHPEMKAHEMKWESTTS
ncbi:SIS domain-containing protein [Mycolicibacterium sp. P1-18]|uniref:SIS domain-containing protein n=1 Tax=Mycolicibacterium sp. P1-18 TaxID=2024615 RepID=UPI0011F1C235|nr:SIS domain-containing protein [Mycolicibacterium sp. P1-18]KAA0098121.1 SIS domain-containing protein [Mycolicibacterium sp. P1-18]